MALTELSVHRQLTVRLFIKPAQTIQQFIFMMILAKNPQTVQHIINPLHQLRFASCDISIPFPEHQQLCDSTISEITGDTPPADFEALRLEMFEVFNLVHLTTNGKPLRYMMNPELEFEPGEVEFFSKKENDTTPWLNYTPEKFAT